MNKKKISHYYYKGKTYSKDFILRISSTAISIVASKVLVLPFLAAMFPIEEYGLMLTIIGIQSIISLAFGNTLYTVRMIMNSEYKKENIEGDFNIIIITLSFISGLLIIPFLFIFTKLQLLDSILLIPYCIASTANTYFRVYYAINLKFKQGLYQSIISSIGLIIGIILSWITHSWVICYFTSVMISVFWIAYSTDIFKEEYKFTPLIKYTLNKFYLLLIATSLGSGLVYLDRFILYPIIGSTSVAIFITSSYFGKIVSIIAQPISSVMLSYYAQSGFNMTIRKLGYTNIILILVLIVFSLIIFYFGNYFTRLFFPSFIEDATPYIFVASLSSSISSLAQLISPIALKFANTKWITAIQIVYAIIYLSFGVFLSKKYGLIGFCYLALILNIFHYIMMNLLCYYSIKKQNSKPLKVFNI